jgi:hypothetical protein
MRFTNVAKKTILTAGLGLGLAFAASSAQAAALVLTPAPNPGDILSLKFGGYTAENPGVPTGNSGGQETTWGVGYLSEIDNHTQFDTRIWDGNGANAQNTSVDFIMYGIADRSYTPGSPGTLQNVGCTVGSGCDGSIHIDFYGIDGTDPVRSGLITTASRTGFNTVAGISDVGTLLMRWVLTPGDIGNTGDDITTLNQFVNSDVLPTTGSGSFLANCVEGVACSLFQGQTQQLNGLTSLFGDVRGAFTLQTCAPTQSNPCPDGNFPNGFAGFINDPVVAVAASQAVPEPTTLALLGAGLLLLGRRSRRNAKV